MSQQTALPQNIRANKGVITASTLFDEIKSFFTWWYIETPVWYVGLIQRAAVVCDDTFSMSLMFKSFFVPWKRDYTWVGFFFGITIRLLYLPIAFAITAVVVITLILVALGWALLPAIAVFYLLKTPFL